MDSLTLHVVGFKGWTWFVIIQLCGHMSATMNIIIISSTCVVGLKGWIWFVRLCGHMSAIMNTIIIISQSSQGGFPHLWVDLVN